MKITQNTIRADGLTVGEAMERDRQFLISIGVPIVPSEEQTDEHRNAVRAAVLDALDLALGGKGWIDAELPQLFKALDAHITSWEARGGH